MTEQERDERMKLALQLRETGMTWREVGENLGTSPSWACELAVMGRRLKELPAWLDGLSVRTRRALEQAGHPINTEAEAEAFLTTTTCGILKKIPKLGPKSLEEIVGWLARRRTSLKCGCRVDFRCGTRPKLYRVLADLINVYELREKHGEDTLGVLMKCGAFRHGNITEIARRIDKERYRDD